MDEKSIERGLKILGIGGGLVTLIIGVSVGATIYKNYFEIKKLKLDIARLKQLLANPVFPPALTQNQQA